MFSGFSHAVRHPVVCLRSGKVKCVCVFSLQLTISTPQICARCVSALFVKLTHSGGHTPVCICNMLCSQTHTPRLRPPAAAAVSPYSIHCSSFQASCFSSVFFLQNETVCAQALSPSQHIFKELQGSTCVSNQSFKFSLNLTETSSDIRGRSKEAFFYLRSDNQIRSHALLKMALSRGRTSSKAPHPSN